MAHHIESIMNNCHWTLEPTIILNGPPGPYTVQNLYCRQTPMQDMQLPLDNYSRAGRIVSSMEIRYRDPNILLWIIHFCLRN
ncbi:hypothetical protein OIU77_025885 [Salix suchowensis]|uniref:Uncharacterized protein n=1 Tax=Salix suchowensis TaxID=1278906 RepID=A0ABQ9C1C1_9ROSI|nr:hypothetical protein OIU77_025885 [Salix suchowensis]